MEGRRNDRNEAEPDDAEPDDDGAPPDDGAQPNDGAERDEAKGEEIRLDEPRLEPGTTAPLDHLTEEEQKSGPMGITPGSGPEPDEARHSGAEAQDAREDQKEEAQRPDESEGREDRGDG